MEAIWKLEDKWKLTTQEAILLFVCTAILVVGLCTATALKKKRSSSAKRKQLQQQEVNNQEAKPIGLDHDQSISSTTSTSTKWYEPKATGWGGSIKRVLMGSVRWSRPNRGERRPPPLLGAKGCESDQYIGCGGWQSHNSVSPVWQRPILMGEKCELPRFSGLILYDERGLPLDHSNKEAAYEEKTPVVKRTTLRDLL